MRHCRLAEAVLLLLGASLLLVPGQAQGQSPTRGEVIATAVPVTADTPAVPAPFPPHAQATPLAHPAPAMNGTIQQTAFVAEPASPAAPPASSIVPTNGLVLEPSKSAPAPTPLAPAPVAPANGLPSGAGTPAPSGSPNTTAALVSVDVTGPAHVSIGQPVAHEIVIRNAGYRAIAEVHVEEALPPGVRVLRTDPPALTHGDRVTWDMGALEAGTERRLKIEVQPASAGELHLRPHVTFLPSSGLRTQVIRPQFGVELKADHDKTPCGGHIAFTIRVSNDGNAVIHNIKLYDQLPAGLSHPAGQRVGITRFGDLQPGETRTITLDTSAVKAGQFRNEVVAQADGGIEARASVEVTVAEPSLALRVDGPKKGSTQRDLDFQLEVSNPGPLPAKKIRLVQTLPPSFQTIGASTGATFDEAQHALTWTLPELAPGQRQRVTFRVKASTAGDWPLYTAVQADKIPESHVANVLHVEGVPALTLEVHAREDRLNVGDETVYDLHVFNQGDAPCAGVRLTAWLPEEMTPLDAKDAQIQQQQVQFAPLSQLPARGDVVYRIRARGQRPGKGRVRVELTAERENPLQRDLSIQVNGGPPAQTPDGATRAGYTKSTGGGDLR
ncbi:MAG TPA: hypothetical protein VN688_11025 [Gemmataceae bacterium]|nr:hypothetical protein [Gemmataceae bacterium]